MQKTVIVVSVLTLIWVRFGQKIGFRLVSAAASAVESLMLVERGRGRSGAQRKSRPQPGRRAQFDTTISPIRHGEAHKSNAAACVRLCRAVWGLVRNPG